MPREPKRRGWGPSLSRSGCGWTSESLWPLWAAGWGRFEPHVTYVKSRTSLVSRPSSRSLSLGRINRLFQSKEPINYLFTHGPCCFPETSQRETVTTSYLAPSRFLTKIIIISRFRLLPRYGMLGTIFRLRIYSRVRL